MGLYLRDGRSLQIKHGILTRADELASWCLFAMYAFDGTECYKHSGSIRCRQVSVTSRFENFGSSSKQTVTTEGPCAEPSIQPQS